MRVSFVECALVGVEASETEEEEEVNVEDEDDEVRVLELHWSFHGLISSSASRFSRRCGGMDGVMVAGTPCRLFACR